MKWQATIFLFFLLVVATIGDAQSLPLETQVRGYWVDPDTGLTWAGKDSGKDLSWKKAVKYCSILHLGSYSDWRLANMFELRGIYDPTANAPGLAGMHSEEPSTWHVKGNLFLTAYEWSNVGVNFRGRPGGYQYYFDFNDGKSNDDPIGWPYPHQFRRALCVRGADDQLGGQSKR